MAKSRINIYSPHYNKLAAKFFTEYVLANKDSNVVISPLSIIVLLAIAADATDGKTRKEIAGVLKGGLPYDDTMEIISLIQKVLSDSGNLVSSNAAIVRKTIENSINSAYRDRIASKFGGELFCTTYIANLVYSCIKY